MHAIPSYWCMKKSGTWQQAIMRNGPEPPAFALQLPNFDARLLPAILEQDLHSLLPHVGECLSWCIYYAGGCMLEWFWSTLPEYIARHHQTCEDTGIWISIFRMPVPPPHESWHGYCCSVVQLQLMGLQKESANSVVGDIHCLLKQM